jgi:PIN domain nuclease of toxin-antitoxin system
VTGGVARGVLLDTHIALWLDSGNAKLRPSTRELIDRCWHDGGVIMLSAVTAWEIGVLVERGKIVLDLPPHAWVRRFLRQPGIQGVPLHLDVAARTGALADLPHRDPGDRLLIATAIDLGCPLITYDERIAGFARDHGSRYGLLVEQ